MASIAQALAVLAALAGFACVEDRYRCSSHAQCDVGEAGRCERDQRCSYWDESCPAGRRYAEHAGDATGACVDDRVVPENPCADGQPPALPAGCFADVCAALPACCEIGWSSACVQEAQLRCPDLRCDTRIAVTAKQGTATELWDLRWDGAAWSATAAPAGDLVAWLAPARATTEPRLVHFTPGAMSVGALAIPLGARSAESAASVDLDRTGSDIVAIGALDADSNAGFVEIADLEIGEVRESQLSNASASAWGDYNGDGFPDAAFGSPTSSRSTFAKNVHTPSTPRALDTGVTTELYFGSGPTQGQTSQIRSYDWNDVTGDGRLDLVISGNSVRVHEGGPTSVPDGGESCDCDPVRCMELATCERNPTFAATVVRSPDVSTVWLASSPYRVLTTLTVNPTKLTPVPLPQCTGCPPFVALAARDLDGDHAIDLVAIDHDLGVWHLLANGTPLQGPYPIPTTLSAFPRVRISVTGAPLP